MTHLHRHAQLSVLTADLPASAGMQQVHHSRSMSSPHGAAYKFAAVRSRGGYISLYDAAAADEGDFGEEAFPDEDGEDLSVSSGELLAPRGQVWPR